MKWTVMILSLSLEMNKTLRLLFIPTWLLFSLLFLLLITSFAPSLHFFFKVHLVSLTYCRCCKMPQDWTISLGLLQLTYTFFFYRTAITFAWKLKPYNRVLPLIWKVRYITFLDSMVTSESIEFICMYVVCFNNKRVIWFVLGFQSFWFDLS
jgi:hypothetical protein